MGNQKTTGDIHNTSINFFIIREIFNIINNKDIAPAEFYVKLLGLNEGQKSTETDDKKTLRKASDIYTNLVTRATVKASNYAGQIAKYGFSESFFMDTEAKTIIAPELCIDEITTYLTDTKLMELEEIREYTIIPYIFEYKNEDDTLIVDCVKGIIDEIVNKRTNNEATVNEVLEYVADYPCNVGTSQKVIKNFYHQIGKSFEKQTPYKDVQLPEENTFNKSKRIYVTSDNEKIKQNLLLIKEAFYLLASMDENEILMPYFYLYLDCTELEYNEYIRNGNIPTRQLADKFQLFKFPATIFKGEASCDIDIVIDNYYSYNLNRNFDIDDENKMNEFRNALRLALCYRIDNRNIPFFMAVYSMYEYIKMSALAEEITSFPK